ncbi:nucleoside triphosphate pyrophosphohydrolase [soil metagenome]
MTPSQPDPDRPADAPHTASVDGDVASDDAILDRSLALVRYLRLHCEWDAAQTPTSLLPHLIEEAHEVADAVATRDDAALTSELGDLLLNVAFQIVLGEERAAFTAEEVVASLEGKMRRRHPHLYGDGERVDWDELKRREREGDDVAAHGLLHGVAPGLEPLSRAQRIQERVAAVGFDWPDANGAFDKVTEEVAEVRELIDARAAGNHRVDTDTIDDDRVAEEIGDLIFAVVNLARLSGVHAMQALTLANAKFERRFKALEALTADRGVVLGEATLEELDEVWDEVKRRENRSG